MAEEISLTDAAGIIIRTLLAIGIGAAVGAVIYGVAVKFGSSTNYDVSGAFQPVTSGWASAAPLIGGAVALAVVFLALGPVIKGMFGK